LRARGLKPGFFHNEDLIELPFEYRLLFAGLWCLADREGRLEDRPKKIKLNVFPGDNVDVDAGLQALHDRGFIQRYSHGTVRYIQILAWKKHQHPHIKEGASTIPAPCEHSASTVQAPDEQQPRQGRARLTPSSLTPDSGLRTPDSREEKKEEGSSNPVEQKLDTGPVERVFEHWRSEFGHRKAVLDPKRRRVIQAALKLHDEETLRQSISGYRNSPHHMGENDQRTVYDDISLFLRDATRIENGLRFARGPPAPALSAVAQARQKLRESVNGSGRVVSEQSGQSEGNLGQIAGLLR